MGSSTPTSGREPAPVARRSTPGALEAVAALHALAASPPPFPEGRFDGRGLVMCAGGPRLLTCAWVSLAVLRRTLGFELPVELWHLGPPELGPVEASLFGELDVEVVDAWDVRRRQPARILGGWELKAYAVTHTRFREVLLLDADNVAAVDPTYLFSTPQYRETGALFWPDGVRLSADNPLWELCRVPYRSEPAWETGQLVVDKARCWRSLALALHMNMHSDVFYEHSHGDKDTFHMAWLMTGEPYAMTTHPTRATPLGLVQRDFDGRMLFQHRSGARWVLRGDNARSPDFRWEEECLAYLEELRGKWTGRIDAVPPRGPEDRDIESDLAEIRWFDYERVGFETRSLELLPAHRIGLGRSGPELRWHVQDRRLFLGGIGGVTCALQRGDDGAWRGRWARAPRHEVELRPRREEGSSALESIARQLLERAAEGELDPEDVLVTLATLAQVGDLSDVLERQRSRRSADPELTALVERVAVRLGTRNPSARSHRATIDRGYDRLG